MRRDREKQNKRSGVLICGAYGMSNAGDEAILEAVLGEMRAIDPEMPITVLSRSPRLTAERYGVKSLHMFDLPGFLREMKEKKLYINGGGSLIQDVTSSRSLWYYLYTLHAAHRRGCRVLMYGCGIGPVSRGFNRRLARRVINSCADEITLREKSSLDELESFGVTRPRITLASDPALTLSPAGKDEIDEKLRSLGLEEHGNYICFCMRDWAGFEKKAVEIAAAADFFREHCKLEPVFLSVNHKSDGDAAKKVARHMKNPPRIIAEPMSTALTVGVISRMRVLVSIRLHGLIFAASQGVPLVGISYDPKVAAFLDYIGQKNCLPLSELSAERLEKLIDRALCCDREELAGEVRRLKDIESRNLQAAKRLLSEE